MIVRRLIISGGKTKHLKRKATFDRDNNPLTVKISTCGGGGFPEREFI